MAIIAKRINNGISLVLVLVAIMGRKILVEIPKSLLRRGLLRPGGDRGSLRDSAPAQSEKTRAISKPTLKLELEVFAARRLMRFPPPIETVDYRTRKHLQHVA